MFVIKRNRVDHSQTTFVVPRYTVLQYFQTGISLPSKLLQTSCRDSYAQKQGKGKPSFKMYYLRQVQSYGEHEKQSNNNRTGGPHSGLLPSAQPQQQKQTYD